MDGEVQARTGEGSGPAQVQDGVLRVIGMTTTIEPGPRLSISVAPLTGRQVMIEVYIDSDTRGDVASYPVPLEVAERFAQDIKDAAFTARMHDG